jgi:hypothetical protein
MKLTILYCASVISIAASVCSCSNYLKSDGKIYKRYANESVGIGKNEIPQADYDSFRSFDSKLAADKNHVFYGMRILEGADAASFTPVAEYYFKDKVNVYFFGFGNGQEFVIKDADPASFNVSKYPWSRDSNNVFWGRKKLVPRPSLNFKPVNDNWAKDENRIYYASSLVDSADSKTFKILNKGYARDRKHVFYEGIIIPDCRPSEFIALNFANGHDRKYFYSGAERNGELTPDQIKHFRFK